MNTDRSLTLKRVFLEVLALTAIAAVVPAIVLFDFMVLANELEESSITEILQEIILFACLVFMLWRAKSSSVVTHSAFVLAAGFFASLFIREFDFIFDRTPVSWTWPVAAVVLTSLIIAWRDKQNTLASLMRFASSRPYAYFLVGFITLFIFSRLFGSGGFLWKAVMGDAYTHVFKTVIQEGLELFAYAIMGFGIFTSKVSDWMPLEK